MARSTGDMPLLPGGVPGQSPQDMASSLSSKKRPMQHPPGEAEESDEEGDEEGHEESRGKLHETTLVIGKYTIHERWWIKEWKFAKEETTPGIYNPKHTRVRKSLASMVLKDAERPSVQFLLVYGPHRKEVLPKELTEAFLDDVLALVDILEADDEYMRSNRTELSLQANSQLTKYLKRVTERGGNAKQLKKMLFDVLPEGRFPHSIPLEQ